MLPPTRVASIPHDEWVSGVSCGMQGHFITASYDGLLRIFDSSRELVHTVSGHSAPATSVCVVRRTDSQSQSNVLLASASHDCTARLTSYDHETKISRTLASLHLHSSPVSSVTSTPEGTHLLTTGWDNLIGIWDTQIPSTDEVAAESSINDTKSRKRRRVATDDII